ncbi:APC family permease, partial [Aminipila sp.]|uniref:APC family permease n=1 Tax=Aminipila sp. TaxID=2060095 RepID=UPI0028974F59
MSVENQKLVKAFSTKDVLALAFGTMIGWGWIMLSGQWAANAGMLGAISAYVVGAILCVFVGMAYAELTPAIPCTGGSVVFSYKAMGYWPSVIAGLATAFAYLGVAAWEGPAFATAIDYVIPIKKIGYLWTIQGYDVYISWAAVAVIASIIITVVNLRGAKQAAIFQTIATLGLILVGALFVFGGVTKGHVEYTKPLFTNVEGFASVLLMVPAMFVGFDVIPQSAGEMNVPLKKIPKLLILSICAAALWYMLMIFSTCMSAPVEVRVNGTIPVADAMAYAFGSPLFGK